MIVLSIRTDKPEAELRVYDGRKQKAEQKWQAHLKLAETLNNEIDKILNKLSISYDALEAVAVFKGPGSYTGLRIGMSVANAIAYSRGIPIVARGGDKWIEQSLDDIHTGANDRVALPEYGGPAHTTTPKK